MSDNQDNLSMPDNKDTTPYERGVLSSSCIAANVALWYCINKQSLITGFLFDRIVNNIEAPTKKRNKE